MHHAPPCIKREQTRSNQAAVSFISGLFCGEAKAKVSGIDSKLLILDLMADVMSLFRLNVFGFRSEVTEALWEIRQLPYILPVTCNFLV